MALPVVTTVDHKYYDLTYKLVLCVRFRFFFDFFPKFLTLLVPTLNSIGWILIVFFLFLCSDKSVKVSKLIRFIKTADCNGSYSRVKDFTIRILTTLFPVLFRPSSNLSCCFYLQNNRMFRSS